MLEEAQVKDLVINRLIQAGWNKDDILLDQRVTLAGRLIQVDLLLLYELFPFAIIEVKSSSLNVNSGVEQASAYAEIINVPFAFSTNGVSILEVKYHQIPTEFPEFPSPKDLWEVLGNDWNKNDPLFFPAVRMPRQLRYYQAIAVSRSIEFLKEHRKIQLVMATGSGKSVVALQLIWKTLQSGFLKNILVICTTIESLAQTARTLSPLGDDVIVIGSLNQARSLPDKKVVLASQNLLFRTAEENGFDKNFAAVIFLDDFNKKFIEDFSAYFDNSSLIVFSSIKKSLLDFEIAYQFTLSDAILQEEEIKVPGFKSVSLGSVAEIKVGQFLRSELESDPPLNQVIKALTGRSILDNGTIDLTEVRNVISDEKRPVIKLQPKDILISSISSGLVRVGYVPNDFKDDVTFLNSLILIRVDSTLADPAIVFEYLLSSNGQLQLKRYASTLTAMIRILPSQISGMPILIPEKGQNASSASNMDFGVAFNARETIEKEILPLLEKLSNKKRDGSENESELEYVAEKLRSVSLKLAPPKLEDKILNQYPMPIAMSYRRFLDSKFNTFEQILRLRDLFESASFFVYNVILANHLRLLDSDKYAVKDAGARRAYNGYSMSKRIDFLDEILIVAIQNGNKDDLFIPEILESDIISKLKSMGEFRNLISHTAAATESRQKKLIDRHRPIVENILESLEFLTSYRLVRIPEFKFKNGRLMRRMEIYAGVVPELEEFPVSSDNEYVKADADHLILLDQEDQFLDLFPIYQLLASDETHDETHMCFLKQRKTEQKKLFGESVQGSFEVTLDGYDVFEELQQKVK